jgi:hypothetical protein
VLYPTELHAHALIIGQARRLPYSGETRVTAFVRSPGRLPYWYWSTENTHSVWS